MNTNDLCSWLQCIFTYNNYIKYGYNNKYKRDGYGKIIDQDGLYEGEFYNGKKEGNGKYTSKNGTTYEGEWLNNKAHGIGKIVFVEDYISFTVYEGEFRNGQMFGLGKLYSNKKVYNQRDSEDGEMYEGNFTDGYLNGPGTYKLKNIIFDVIFEMDIVAGQSKMKSLNPAKTFLDIIAVKDINQCTNKTCPIIFKPLEEGLIFQLSDEKYYSFESVFTIFKMIDSDRKNLIHTIPDYMKIQFIRTIMKQKYILNI